MQLRVNTQGRTLIVTGELIPEMDIYPPSFDIEKVMEGDADVTEELWLDDTLGALCTEFALSLTK